MADMALWADKPMTLLTTPQSKQADPSKPENQFIDAASEMCLVHNALIRGYNSVVLQAAHVKPEDVSDFVHYCKCWLSTLHRHHEGEEDMFFPEIEKAAGEACMQENIEQHHLFHDGMEKTLSFLEKSERDPSSYSGAELIEILESFGDVLHQHLSEEIATLLALEKYGDKVPVKELLQRDGDEVMKKMPFTTDLTAVWVLIDSTFENGIWKSWPPAPAPIKWGLRNVFPYRYRGWWRFAPCDWNGIPKPLYAVSS